MALIVDAGPLVAFADRDDPMHATISELIKNTREELILSPFVVAEADYLIGRELGVDAELAFLRDVAADRLSIEPIDASDVARCLAIVERYRDLDIGIADASILVLCERFRTTRVATFDIRHFRAFRTSSGDSLELLPEDSGP